MEHYSNLFKYNPLPTFVYEIDSFQIIDVNESAITHYGFPREEFLLKKISDLCSVDQRSRLLQSQNRILNQEDSIDMGVFTHYKKNGDLIRMNIHGYEESCKNKKCIVIVCKDITLKEKMIQTNHETQKIMDASLDVICSLDEDGKFIQVSAASKSFWGYSPEELIGTSYIELIHPEDIELSDQAADEILSSEILTTFENRYIKKNGEVAYNLWSARWDAELKILYAVARDASGIKRKEEILIESESRFKALVQEGSDLIAILDEKSVYKYVSPTSRSILGFTPEEFTGRNAFEFIHPDDAEKIKKDLVKILTEVRVQVEPFRFRNKNGDWRWIETIFTNLLDNPSINGIVANSRDITSLKEEEHRLKLLESVVLNTRDAVMITEAEPQNEPGPKILYVNPAFTKMTGYSFDEVVGKSPRFLQGPKSNREELDKLSASMKRWESCEITIINYKKNGEEFWLNFRISPVADDKGCYTHWVSIEKDVTAQKNEEIERELLALISTEFKSGKDLFSSLNGFCKLIVNFDDFSFCEVWLPTLTNGKLRLYSKCAKDKAANLFYENSEFLSELSFGEGLPGAVWKNNTSQVWDNLSENKSFVRRLSAEKSGINAMMGLPLLHKNKVVGVMVLGTNLGKSDFLRSNPIFEKLKDFIGSEINRKKLEDDLRYLFEALPNVVGVADFNGEVINVNKTGCELLEYQESELIGKSLFDFIHPEDHLTSIVEMDKLKDGESVFNFENRYISKSGKIIWLSWQCSSNKNEEVVFATATNITYEKKLKELIDEASQLAIIGGWEVDVNNNQVTWSDVVHEIYETDPLDFSIKLEDAIDFYKPEYRELIREKLQQAQIVESSFDFEAVLVTGKGKHKWVRAIMKSEVVDGKCIRLYGSIQDIDERKRLDEKLHEILRSITDGFYALDENWRFTYFNKEAERLLNRTSEDVLGKELWEVFPASKGTLLETYYRNVASSGVAQNFEYLYPGDNCWYELNAYPSNGGVASYFKNIDAKKKASEELEKAYLEKDQILDSIGDAFFAVDNDWIVTYWNRVAEEVLSKKREEVVGKDLWSVYNDATDTNFYRKYYEAKETGKVVAFEELYTTLDLWFEVTIYPSESGLSVYFKDITERKKSDLKILQANERFEKVAQATSDAIWDWDIENSTFYRGNGFAELFGYEENGMHKQSDFWKDLLHPDDLPRIQKSIHNTLNNPDMDYWKMEYRIISSNNDIRKVTEKGMIIRNDSGVATRIVGAITDITESKRYELELQELNDKLRVHATELELTNEQLEQFAYIASHDLQEPLRMISSFLSQLERRYSDQLDDKALKYIYFATDGAKRMKQIILDLLEYSRAGKIDFEPEEINLNQIFDEYRVLRKKVIEESKVILKFNSLPVVVGRKTPLTQTIHSLVDNAIKYRKPTVSPVIEISVTSNVKWWTFKVKDNGIGIDNQFYDKIFVIFQRLHNRDDYDGTGIGLSVAKKNIESWGGRIWVESVLNEGSTFFFTVPKS